MRYVAKIYVLDIMDQVAVSGYVYDADPLTDPDHTPLEFTYTGVGKGLDDPVSWLVWHVYEALQDMTRPQRGGRLGPGRMGGGNTISETGDSGADVMG